MRTLFLAAALSAVTAHLPAAAVPQGASPPAAEVAASLQRKYDTLTDFSADFSHTYEGGVLKRKSSERSHLEIPAT